MRRLFISDLHLQSERPEITAALIYFLEQIAPGCDELYLLGDIFEAWIGDDWEDPVLPAITPAFTKLASQGTQIFLQQGNRDFLLGDAGAARLSAKLLPEEYALALPQGAALLVHGDQLCTDDQDYQRLRKQVRSAEWQQAILSQPVSERLKTAKKMRMASKAANAEKSDQIMDVNLSAVSEMMERNQVELLIHGHTHRPAIHTKQRSSKSGTRIVLGDWGTDGWYLISDGDRLELNHFLPCSA